jgi:hypothetical protein
LRLLKGPKCVLSFAFKIRMNTGSFKLGHALRTLCIKTYSFRELHYIDTKLAL